MYAFVIFLVAVIQSICLHQYFIRVMVVGMRLRTAVMSIVYKKVGMERAGWTHPLHDIDTHSKQQYIPCDL